MEIKGICLCKQKTHVEDSSRTLVKVEPETLDYIDTSRRHYTKLCTKLCVRRLCAKLCTKPCTKLRVWRLCTTALRTTVLRTTVLRTTALLRRLYINALCRALCRASCRASRRASVRKASCRASCSASVRYQYNQEFLVPL